MHTDKQLIYEILLPRVDHSLLEGFYEAVFNEERNKFFACTYVDLSKIEYEEFWYGLNKLGGGSIMRPEDDERRKNYITPNSWSYKTQEECVKEGIYRSYSIRFSGMHYEGEWYVMEQLCYFGDNITEEHAKNHNFFNGEINKYWNSQIFSPDEGITMPSGEKLFDVEMQEFKGQPWIVAHLKQKRKSAVNRAYKRYMNEEIFCPLIEKLKVKFPNEYHKCISLFGEDFTLIFPANKKSTIMAVMVKNAKNEKMLMYFLHESLSNKIYQWTYIKPKTGNFAYHYSNEIISELKKISDWNDEGFLDSSRTMDDENFWNNYVFKKENGEYLYLKEVVL